jgi:voltage-gated potassium channel
VLSGIWIGETFLSAAFGGQLSRELRHMQIERTIDGVEDHVIVCGYGTFGKTVVAALEDRGRDVVVIEIGDEQSERALADDRLVIQGDARDEGTLRDAGLARARSVVGAVDDANVNIQTVLAAGQLAPAVNLVVRVGDETDATLARRAGADEVVIPEVLSGEQVGTEV